MEKKKPINWKTSNFLKTKKGNVIVVNHPNHTDDAEFFAGTIIYAEESQTGNKPLYYSTHFRKEKFERLDASDVSVNINK
jgi:hypothetical protein